MLLPYVMYGNAQAVLVKSLGLEFLSYQFFLSRDYIDAVLSVQLLQRNFSFLCL